MTLILINPLNEVSSNTSLYLVQTAFPGREETLESNWRAERRSCPSCPRLCPAGMVVVGRSSFLPCHHVSCALRSWSYLSLKGWEGGEVVTLWPEPAGCCLLPPPQWLQAWERQKSSFAELTASATAVAEKKGRDGRWPEWTGVCMQ